MAYSAPTALPALFAALHAAPSADARDHIAGLIYQCAHAPLTARCALLLRAQPDECAITPADLASDALVRAVLLGRSARCRSSTPAGVLRYLMMVARTDLLAAQRAGWRQRIAVQFSRIGEREFAGLPAADAAAHDRAQWNHDFFVAYSAAVRRLPPIPQSMWIRVIEECAPIADVAYDVGIHRTTVWRHVQSAAAILAPQLQRFAAHRVALANHPIQVLCAHRAPSNAHASPSGGR